MKEYFLTIITSTFFLALLDGVLPNSKNAKAVKSVIAVLSVCIILTPILKIFNSNYDIYSDNQILLEYNDYLNYYQNNVLKVEVSYLLENNGYDVIEVDVLNENSVNLIKVILSNNGINDEDEHIDSIENAKQLITKRLYLDLWEVTIVYA